MVLIQRSIIHLNLNFDNETFQTIREKDGREDKVIEYFCTNTQLLIGTSTEEIKTVDLRETEFQYSDESDQNSIYGQFSSSGFICKENNSLFGSQVTSYTKKSRLTP